MEGWLAVGWAVPALMWLGLLAAPWQPWRTRERLEADPHPSPGRFDDVTVVIPARDEAAVLGRTLEGVRAQAGKPKVIVVDEQSSDDTAGVARGARLPGLTVVRGQPMPRGWTGKLWALEQGLRRVETPLVLLLDADIVLLPGTLAALHAKLRGERLQLVSLMAWLRMESFWEKLLMPAFVYFFKLIYPFGLSNRGVSQVAAAAGGCMLIECAALERIGGFAALRDALIDDCTLARRVQQTGGRTWVGLTHSARSLRRYDSLASIWSMVARTAFTQLRHSTGRLLACTGLFLVAFALPWLALGGAGPRAPILGVTALLAAAVSYLPTLRFYRLSPLWAATMPVIAMSYLAMTWDSARREWLGLGARWRGRAYGAMRSVGPRG